MLTLLLIVLARKIFAENKSRFDLSLLHAVLLRIVPGGFSLFLLLIPVSGFTQEHTYSIIKGTTPIGTLSATCTKINSRSIYSIWSEAKTRFIIDIHVYVTIDEIFESGQMEHSVLIRKINGKEKVNNTAEKTGESYVLKKRDNTNKITETTVTRSMATLYFIEPKNLSYVYSEYYQQLVQVIPTGTNRYLIEFPNGNESYYTYSNGVCTEVEAHTDWATIFFRLYDTHSVNDEMTKK
jgi:hypothetical protein